MAKHASSMQSELYDESGGYPPGVSGFVSGDSVSHPLPLPHPGGHIWRDIVIGASVLAISAAGWFGYQAIKPKVEINPPAIVQPAPNNPTPSLNYPIQPTPIQPTPTMNQQYRSQITQYLMQDVPALSQDSKAFNYAVDRLAEWGTIGIKPVDYQSIRQPLIKWIDANITWQNKGERLYPMSEVDFLTDYLFNPVISGGIKLDYPTYFGNNVNYLVNKHNELWNLKQNQQELKKYFDEADSWIKSNVERSPVALEQHQKYMKALWEQGTDADRLSFAVYGYAILDTAGRTRAQGVQQGEGSRVPLEILYMESIGGEAQFSGMGFSTGMHEEPSIKISKQLEGYLRSNKQYGTLLDSGYLTVPYNTEGAEAMKTAQISLGLPKMVDVERWPRLWQGERTVLWKANY